MTIQDPGGTERPRLTCYRTDPDPPPLVPARSPRDWMDETPNRFAYRCTPLSIANASGWEILCPQGFTASWEGSIAQNGITVAMDDGSEPRFAVSHFGAGVLTFHTGYLFRTSPGWALWARGAPNSAKDGIAPLDGLVETDWLPLPFTMNWRFTRRGATRFEKGEPFCFITLFPHALIEHVEPQLADLPENPDLDRHHTQWSIDRLAFNAGLASGDPEATAQGWQRRYLRGEEPNGAPLPHHRHKRKLLTPRESRRDSQRG